MAKKPRKKKFVVLLANKADRQDDEWQVIWARNYKEAYKISRSDDFYYESWRFDLSHVLTAVEFKNYMGISA